MVRAYQNQFKEFFDNSIVAVGWSNVDFSSFSGTKKLVDEIQLKYKYLASRSPTSRGKTLNQIRRFKLIKKDDKILVPYWSNICLAIATGKEVYKATAGSHDQSNQHEVDYLRDASGDIIFIPRTHLSEALQRRLRVMGSIVSDLDNFSKELDDLFSGQTFDSTFSLKQDKEIEKFKQDLLGKIKSGSTLLKAGGIGLERLIKHLLELEGYNAKICGKSTFSGLADADIIATKEDRFLPTKLLVQVKHHQGVESTWGAEQLTAIEEECLDCCKLVLVTTAKASDDLIEMCEKKDITLLEGEDLMDWIYDMLPKMNVDFKKKLRISDVPIIIN
ncbi:restriction endonuclease [Candidatus Albibeggiatoa sp. nov. BB20]|uniref:restriction endonuclease n=1 Tax=Candidatus Albibeggiatoa sp. nov. BB20 TaxID=3162723 RepID=UPI0033657625